MTENLYLGNPCKEGVLWTTSPYLQSLIACANILFCIATMLSINIIVPYMMYSFMSIYMATLRAILGD